MTDVPSANPLFTITPFRRNGSIEDPVCDEAYTASIGEPAAVGRPLPKLEVIQVSTFAQREFQQRRWLVKDMIPDRTVTLLIGDGGTGKSLLAQQLAVAVAADRDWIGTLPEPGRVVYLSAEDDTDEVHRRLVDITTAASISFDDLEGLHLVPLAGKDAVLALPDRRSEILATTPLWEALVEKVRTIGPRLVVIDNLADAFAGNENSRPQARQFIGILRGLAIEHDLAVVLLSHPSVSGMATGTGTSGSTAWSNSARSRLYLERARSEDGDEPDPDLRILRLMKANHAALGTEIRVRWAKGRFKLDGSGPGAFDRIAAESRAEKTFLDLLQAFRAQDRDVSSKVSNSYAPAVFASHPSARGISKRAFANAMNRLFETNQIRNETFGPPSKPRTRIALAEGSSNGLPT